MRFTFTRRDFNEIQSIWFLLTTLGNGKFMISSSRNGRESRSLFEQNYAQILQVRTRNLNSLRVSSRYHSCRDRYRPDINQTGLMEFCMHQITVSWTPVMVGLENKSCFMTASLERSCSTNVPNFLGYRRTPLILVRRRSTRVGSLLAAHSNQSIIKTYPRIHSFRRRSDGLGTR